MDARVILGLDPRAGPDDTAVGARYSMSDLSSDLSSLEAEISAAVSATADERALESVRVATLGKKGSVSERLKELGKMSPDERKVAGPALNGLKERVGAMIE